MSERAATKRRCHIPASETRSGKPCGANPLRPGTVIDGVTVSGNYCRQHDQDLPASARIGGKQPGGGRPRTPRLVDIVKERLEADADSWFDVLDSARRATKVVAVVGEGIDAEPVEVEDHRVRLMAFREAMDRSYGRPRVEITGADGAPLQMEVTGAAILNDADARKHAAGLRRRVGAARAVEPRRARAGH